MTSRSIRLALGLALGTAALTAVPAQAAATYEVNSIADLPDANPADGQCRTSAGSCTLRAAVQSSNVQARPIVLPPGRFRLTIPPSPVQRWTPIPDPARGDLNVLNLAAKTVIRGAGARQTIIDGNGVDRVLLLESETEIADLTITGGDNREREMLLVEGGGGIANISRARLERVAVTGNRAEFGGGIFNIPGSDMTIVDSTISGNTANEAGGVRFDWRATVINTTIAGNRVVNEHKPTTPAAFAGLGGGVDIRGLGPVAFVNSTIAGNSASDGGGGINAAPGYLDSVLPPGVPGVPGPLGAKVSLVNTIVAGNGGGDCRFTLTAFDSLGGNLGGDRSCNLGRTSDQASADPRLGPLADNGGPTDTRALLPGSPALDAATAGDCPGADQRGVSRPQGPACDIGAYERD